MQISQIKSSKDIQQAIATLEQRMEVRKATIKEDSAAIKEGLEPRNLVKNTFSYVADTPEIQKILINTAIGFLIGYASKKTAKILSESSLNQTTENFVNYHVDRLEKQHEGSVIAQAISMIRRFTPATSSIYPFIRYKQQPMQQS